MEGLVPMEGMEATAEATEEVMAVVMEEDTGAGTEGTEEDTVMARGQRSLDTDTTALDIALAMVTRLTVATEEDTPEDITAHTDIIEE